MLRSPIVAVLGHVDHGKTTLLDKIRGTAVAKKEAGGITQMIGASYIEKETIERIIKDLKGRMKAEIGIPGLMFIDTPGHEAFTNLRERGGSIADIAVLVIDMMQGIQPQTIESMRILKSFKTPFVVAANKADMIRGWKKTGESSILKAMEAQSKAVVEDMEQKIYAIIGQLSEQGFNSERFDRVADFTKEVAIVPISGKTGEGVAELLLIIAGLTQRFMQNELNLEAEQAKGSIMEVKEVKGMGTVLDVILYDGVLKKGDSIAFLGKNGLVKSKVRGIVVTDSKEGLKYVDQAVAAAGIRLIGSDFDEAVAGSPLVVEKDGKEGKIISSEIKNIIFNREGMGLIVRADTLGSLEALVRLLEEKGHKIRKADIGNITRSDICEADALKKEDLALGVVVGFNVKVNEDAREEANNRKIRIISSNIIYRVIEEYDAYKLETERNKKEMLMESLPYPAKVLPLKSHCFRVSKPCIFGIEVLDGILKKGACLMDSEGRFAGEVRGIQEDRNEIERAEKGKKVAISLDGAVYGKEINENVIIYSKMGRDEIRAWEENLELLDESAIRALEEIKRIVYKL
ncbi:MAG: translation initiation factor IF-2 [Candidatus Anstonellales archaeon]